MAERCRSMVKLGRYKTLCGLDAAVVRIRPIGTMGWSYKGSVKYGNLDYIMFWDHEGKCEVKDFDLILE